jgi:glutathione S-transferase
MAEQSRLYVILGSHSCRTGMLLLEHKGIDYRAVRLPTGMHPLGLRMLGFSGNQRPLRNVDGERPPMLAAADRMGTVPALRTNGTRVKTNREIARHLDDIQPEPPLFPADPARRAAVEEAERWGDEELQMVARRLALVAATDADDGRLGPILFRHATVRRAAVAFLRRFVFDADAGTERALRAKLPSMLDRVDAWIADGTLNGEQLYAADYVIAPSLALLTYVRDLEPQLAARPLIGLVDRLLPSPPSPAGRPTPR